MRGLIFAACLTLTLGTGASALEDQPPTGKTVQDKPDNPTIREEVMARLSQVESLSVSDQPGAYQAVEKDFPDMDLGELAEIKHSITRHLGKSGPILDRLASDFFKRNKNR